MKKKSLLSFIKRSNKKTMPNLVSGLGLVEVIVAIFIFTIVLSSLITASNLYLSGAGESLRTAQGAYLAQEGIEAVKIMRDSNWSNISSLTTNKNYYFFWRIASSTWTATTTAFSPDSNFTRTFQLNSVNRDSNGRIISNGGTLDADTKKVTVTVSWKSKNSTTPKILSTYITNII